MKNVRIVLSLLLITLVLSGCMGIHDAARTGNLKAIRTYAEWGGDLDSSERFNLKWSVETPLILAAFNNQYEAVKLLVELGADVNEKGEAWYTPISCTVYAEDTRMMQFLLDNGAEIAPFGEGKSSALTFAARRGNIEAAKLLLSYGADVNHVAANKTTPLHEAAKYGQFEMVKYLVENGAGINAKGFNDKTPLNVVSNRHGNRDRIVNYLKSHGAKYRDK